MFGGTPPELIKPGAGSSQWIEEKMKKAGAITPGAEPESTAGRYGAAALHMIPGALTGKGTLAQLPAKAAAGATSGLAAQAATDVLGHEYGGVGALLPAAGRLAKPSTTGERATSARQAETFKTAREMGIPIPPRAMKPDKVQQALQDQMNQELKQPPGTEISPKMLKQHDAGQWADYEAVVNSPSLIQGVKPTQKFQNELQALGGDIESARKNLPETFKGMAPVLGLLQEYGYRSVPAGGTVGPQGTPLPPDLAMRAIKKLRADATTNFSSDKPEQVQLARIQRKLAVSLEDLLEENLTQNGAPPEVMQKFREARTAIAKSNVISSSLDPTTRKISGARLSQQLTEGAPLSGRLKGAAEVAGQFPEAVKGPKDETYFTQRVSPMAVMHPEAMSAHWMTRLFDPITLSKVYQSMVVDPSKKLSPEQQQFLRFMAASEASNKEQQ